MKKIIVILVIAVFVCLVITPALAWTVSQGSDPTAIMKGAVRYRNFVLSPGGGTGAEIYLGKSDLDLQSNRIELDLSNAATCDGLSPDPSPAWTWIYPDPADSRYGTEFGGGTVYFNYTASTGMIQTRVDLFRVEYGDASTGYRGFIKHSYCSEYSTGNLGDINYIQIDSVAQESQTLVGLRCVNLLSLNDGSHRGLDKTADDFESNNILPSVGGWKTTLVKDPLNELKLSDGFNMWGSFNLQGPQPADAETNKLEISIGHYSPADTTPPTTQISINGDGPHCGWYKTDVMVTLTANDGTGSGIYKTQYSSDTGATWTEYTVPFSITSEGITNVAYRSIDNAGNIEPAHNTDVRIDKTPPTIVAEIIETVPPVNDWYPSSVKVRFTASDAISPIRSDPAGGPGHVYIKDEILCANGKDQIATLTVEDGPGNTATATLYVSIDKTPPTTEISVSGDGPHCGWYKTDVLVTLTATDGTGSGIDKTQYSYDNGASWTDYTAPFTITNEGITNVAYRSIDNAGHTEATQTIDVKIDKTPPTIEAAIIETVPPVNDWYHSSVKVHFIAVDAISYIRGDTPQIPNHIYTEDKNLCTEGKDQPISLTLEDGPGNTATATITVSIDRTPPSITINIPVNCAHYILNEDVHADWTASDTLSGIATQSGTVPMGSAIDTATIGSKQFTVTATDMAGNQNIKTVSYTVDSQADATKETITTVDSLEVPPRIKTVLTAELNGAVTALTNDRPRIAKVLLRAVNLEVKGMSGKQIPADQAAMLISKIQRIINTI